MDTRPYVLYAIVEVTMDDGEEPFVHVHNLYRTREKAERNAEDWRENTEKAL
jgi:uncharacterized protein (DUF362 family)